MGGSSLAPYVFGQIFDTDRLGVLDSTDPDAVASIPVDGSLFVVSSKSGTTVEPNCFADYFEAKVGPRRLVAITDPGSKLEAEAAEANWLSTFPGRTDVGGRYSALTAFGMVPAALAGIPVEAVLEDAVHMISACRPERPIDENPGALLGATIGWSATHGRDKLTIVASPGLDSFGLWLEQLVAESTGKQGVGIVPVAGESLGAPEVYSDDRLFVHIRGDDTHDEGLSRLIEAGHPVLTLPLPRSEWLGGEMVRWEIAVALAGAILGIDPFDQPNVQEAKDLTVKLVDEYVANGSLPAPGDFDTLESLLGGVRPGRTYICLQAFVTPTVDNAGRLAALQGRLRDGTRCAVTAGFGPRYLHSTGQLHKGGAPIGAFIQLLAEDQPELDIPGRPYGFRTLRDAQAQGDASALHQRGLPVVRLSFAEAEKAIGDALDNRAVTPTA